MPGLRTTRSTTIDEEDPAGTTEGGSVRVALQPVVGSVSAPFLDVSDPMPDEPDVGERGEPIEAAAPAVDLPWPRLWMKSVPIAPIAIAFGVGMALGLATGDAAFGVWGGLTAWFVNGLWWVSGRVSFSFGEGFVGYRPDTRWPHGVQEDDDVRWDWRVPRETPDDDEARDDSISPG